MVLEVGPSGSISSSFFLENIRSVLLI
jgi:hypothetical protein